MPSPDMNDLFLHDPSAPAKFRRITRHQGLAEEAYEAIFAQLMALRIAPGSRITVDNLARELDVSQTPIREALGRLQGKYSNDHRFIRQNYPAGNQGVQALRNDLLRDLGLEAL